MVTKGSDCAYYSDLPRPEWLYKEPDANHDYTVIMMHGMKGKAEHLLPLFEDGQVLYKPNQRVVLPQAATRKWNVQTNLGNSEPVPGWFDMPGLMQNLTNNPLWNKVNSDYDEAGK